MGQTETKNKQLRGLTSTKVNSKLRGDAQILVSGARVETIGNRRAPNCGLCKCWQSELIGGSIIRP